MSSGMAGFGDGDGDGGGVMRVSKATCVAFVLVISVWFLLMGIVTSGEIKTHTATASTSLGNHKHAVLLGKKRHYVPVKLDPINGSKRRVPNGPDPIHNRYYLFSFQIYVFTFHLLVFCWSEGIPNIRILSSLFFW